jgi:hypothetical protein
MTMKPKAKNKNKAQFKKTKQNTFPIFCGCPSRVL